jgi:putative DNA primase/helicase
VLVSTAKDYFSYGDGGDLYKQVSGVDVKKICKRIDFIFDNWMRLNLVVSIQEIVNALRNNEDGDAGLYKKLNRDFYIFDHKNNEWYFWKRPVWHKDVFKKSLRAVDSVTAQFKAYRHMGSKVEQHIRQLGTRDRKKRILDLSSIGSNGMGIAGDQWDQKPMLLACSNGVINLKNGDLLHGAPHQYLKTACPTIYDPKAPPPKEFIKFLNSIFDGDQDLIAYIKRLFGYALLGKVIERILVIFLSLRGFSKKNSVKYYQNY